MDCVIAARREFYKLKPSDISLSTLRLAYRWECMSIMNTLNPDADCSMADAYQRMSWLGESEYGRFDSPNL